jgi:hypothetical protein
VKRNIILVLMVLLCFSFVWAQENEKSYSFSAYVGTMRGEFALNLEALYNQRWDKWGIQTSAMANVNKSIHEYGFSVGGWHRFAIRDFTMDFGLFFDALNLDKIPEYGYGGFYGQIRPEFRIVEENLVIDFFYSHPVTKRYLLEKTISKPYFWQDNTSYYYDIVTTTVYAVPMRYFGAGGELIASKFLKLRAEGIYASFEKEEFYRLKAGVEVKPFKWIAFSIDWTEMKAIQALGLNMGGDYQVIRVGATIFLGGNQERGFSNLSDYGVFAPQYSAVRVETKYSLTTTKI